MEGGERAASGAVRPAELQLPPCVPPSSGSHPGKIPRPRVAPFPASPSMVTVPVERAHGDICWHLHRRCGRNKVSDHIVIVEPRSFGSPSGLPCLTGGTGEPVRSEAFSISLAHTFPPEAEPADDWSIPVARAPLPRPYLNALVVTHHQFFSPSLLPHSRPEPSSIRTPRVLRERDTVISTLALPSGVVGVASLVAAVDPPWRPKTTKFPLIWVSHPPSLPRPKTKHALDLLPPFNPTETTDVHRHESRAPTSLRVP